MLRAADKRLFTSGQLENVFSGQAGGLVKAVPSRMFGPSPPVAGYVGWYDASNLANFTNTGHDITAWIDRSGNANDLTVISGNPVLGRNYLGFPVVWFDGISVMGNNISASDRTFTSIACVLVTQINSGRAIIGPSGDGGNEFRINATTGQISTLRADVAIIGTQGNAAVSVGVPVVVAQVLTATDVTHYTNLVSETDADANAFTAARVLRIGAAPTVISPFDAFSGWMGEIVLYDSSLSSGDVQSVISYLMTKWGVV